MADSWRVELVSPDGWTETIEVDEDEAIWEAAFREDTVLPHMCLQGWCLSCAGKVLDGEWDQSDALRYYPADHAAGFVLLCTAKPRSPMRILIGQKAAMQEHRVAHRLPTPRG